jgi:hypothetical protein
MRAKASLEVLATPTIPLNLTRVRHDQRLTSRR